MAQLLGKYEVLQRLAQGGMGEVFLARQTGMAGFDRLAILKTLKPELTGEPGFIDQFLDEARVAATLNHPNIVSIYEVGQAEGTYFIAMEYIAGVDLARLWVAAAKAKLGLPFHVSVKILHDAALGLQHAHHAQDVRGEPLEVVHRDISPQNIMVRGDGVTKVVDFGIAKAQNRVTHTRVGTVKGKLQYMSPEQVKGEPLDGRSDQFSLGVVLWEMCTGKRLFKSKIEVDTLNKILSADVTRPSDVVSAFPQELEDIIMRMLSQKPSDRFPTCGAAAEALTTYLDHSPLEGRVKVQEFVQEVVGNDLDKHAKELAAVLDKEPANRPPDVRVRAQGAEVHLHDEPTLHQWILDGKLGRDDECSTDGAKWVPLGDRPDLIQLFHEFDARRALAAAPHSLAPPGTFAPSLSDSHMVPSGAIAPSSGAVPSTGTLSPTPVTAPMPSHPSQAHPRSYPQSGSHSLGPLPTGHPATLQAPPSWQSTSHEDALDFPPRRSRAGLYLLGLLVVLVVAAGGTYLVVPEKVEALILGSSTAPTVALPASLKADSKADLAKALAASEKKLKTTASGEAKAQVAAEAALLHAALSFLENENARLLSFLEEAELKSADKAKVLGSKAAQKLAQDHRVATYRLAGQARAVAPDATVGQLAMAAYQAARGATAEMTADLNAARARSPEDKALTAEATALSVLAAAAGALDDDSTSTTELTAAQASLTAAKAADASDTRLAYYAVALQVELALRAAPKAAAAETATAAKTLDAFLVEFPTHERARLLRKRIVPDANATPGSKKTGSRPGAGEKVDPFAGKSFDELMSIGRRAASGGRSRTATGAFKAALGKKGNSVEALVGLGWASVDRGRNRGAIRSFEKALRYDSRFAQAHFGLAEARRYDGQKAAAIQSYKRFLELDSTGPDANVAKNAIRALSD